MSSLIGSSIPLFKIKVEEHGTIKDIKEIIVRIDGLPTCLNGQIVDMGDGVKGIIMGYDEEDVLALVLGDPGKLRMGKQIKGISEPFKIPVGDHLLGRMVTALGEPCDGHGEVSSEQTAPVFRDSPAITDRAPIDAFLPTGTKLIDILIPIARGQRQLILGDRMTGKTALALDAIINQKGRDVVCIYCAIGKSLANLEKAAGAFQKADMMDSTIMVVATDNAPVGEQYIVPFAAATIGDYFAAQGKHVLVVFDDLTKHAWSYRQLSLLLERPPGREAYPGDIFYIQTQRMERAGRFNEKYGKGNGSMTFLGIAETQQNDLTGYIPSNLVSMCDGQVVLSSQIFAEGMRPAIDIGSSISITGGRTQPEALKVLGRNVRSEYARYNEVVKLSKLSSGLSDEAAALMKMGEGIETILQQGEFAPVGIDEDIVLLFALEKQSFLNLAKPDKARFMKTLFVGVEAKNASLTEKLRETGDLSDDSRKALDAAFDAVMAEFTPEE
jgi:F-type H+-transporting ATPase subunit alpha